MDARNINGGVMRKLFPWKFMLHLDVLAEKRVGCVQVINMIVDSMHQITNTYYMLLGDLT